MIFPPKVRPPQPPVPFDEFIRREREREEAEQRRRLEDYLFQNALDDFRQKRLANRPPPRYAPGTQVQIFPSEDWKMIKFVLEQRAEFDEQHWEFWYEPEPHLYKFIFGPQKQPGSTWRRWND